MSIRLNKVLTELNIGLQTAVDFLKNKRSLGEIRDDANLSTKISDEQYHALVAQFKGDKDIKNEAEKMFAKKGKDKKSDKKVTSANNLVTQVQKFKPVGKIDLDTVGKPQVAKQSAAQDNQAAQKTAAVSPSAESKPAVETSETKTVAQAEVHTEAPEKPVEKTASEPKPNTAPDSKAEETPKPETKPEVRAEQKKEENNNAPKAEQQKPVQQDKPAQKQEEAASDQQSEEGTKIFTLKSEKKLAPKVNVLGKIDLSALNQSTRPKKK